MAKKIIISIIIVIIAIALITTILIIALKKNNKEIFTGKIDDWKYNPRKYNIDYNTGINYSSTATKNAESIDGNIGFSTGGAKDINNFRENITNGYFPISTDITYNGLFYDYTFDTGNKGESDQLFSPSYSCAISKDPISNNDEYYMTVGLNSNIKESDFQRKKLNLVVVLDISGSMSSEFSSYYYDAVLGKNEEDLKSDDDNKTKMEIANESVNILIDNLNEDDRFGMVLFDDSSYLAKPIRKISETDTNAIKKHILDIQPQGGTNFEAGYTEATELFEEYKKSDKDEYENRIIVITDAMPNAGTTSKKGLLSYVRENANDGIYTTFIGVGVDFNTELIEEISDVRGANYYSVHNSNEFKERMGEQFEYMVTPLVFDLSLDFKSNNYQIETVYGSDTANKENGNIMKVNTLFPSKTTEDGEVKGGVILLKLKKLDNNESDKIELKVSYKDRNGKDYNNMQTVNFEKNDEYYDNIGIRKAIVLTRYANALKNWILYERTEDKKFIIVPNIGITDCIYTEDEIENLLGENERTSVELKVSDEYKETFKKIKGYIERENENIKDENLNQEIKILNKLIEN